MTPYRRRVGEARPSHLMFTGGVGGLIEEPNFTVLVLGLDEWNYTQMGDVDPTIAEPRLLAEVRRRLNAPVKALRTFPWVEGRSDDAGSATNQVGVPVSVFPSWFRCTRCNQLGALEAEGFGFVNQIASRPFEAHFFHKNCQRRDRFAVPARFLVGCTEGHLDEFPYDWFVHKGGNCTVQPYPALVMLDSGSEAAAEVQIRCSACGASRSLTEAQGVRAADNLPACRGRHPHLGTFSECDQQTRLLVLGASNQWFGESVSVLSVPPPQASELEAQVEQLWDTLEHVTTKDVMAYAHHNQFGPQLGHWSLDEVWQAVENRRGQATSAPVQQDILGEEWSLLTETPPAQPTADFAIRLMDVPQQAAGLIAEVRQVERLRMVRAQIGFTRFDAPDPEDPELVTRAPLSRGSAPEWVPATETRGEGVFVRLDTAAVDRWEAGITDTTVSARHLDAFKQFRWNRYSDRVERDPHYDWARGWPELRYYLVHSLSHVLLRAIALECGYSATSLSERIYARPGTDQLGLLIYTAVPDAEGTLGGLAAMAEPLRFARVLDRALRDAGNCSSDPLCAESGPSGSSDACYAASCHVCMFLAETSCERGNRFLDRRFLINLGRPDLAFFSSTVKS